MKELNLNSLLSNDLIITIDDKELKFKKLSAARVFDIAERYNRILRQMIPKVSKSMKHMDEKQKKVFQTKTFEQQAEQVLFSDLKYARILTNRLVDLCFEIVRPVKLRDRIKHRFSKNYISRRWLVNNLDSDQLKQFTDLVLEPITGEKKTMAENS